MTALAETRVRVMIDDAEELAEVPPAAVDKPRLLIEPADPDRTVAALRDVLAPTGLLYDRGVPVRLAYDKIQGGTTAQVMTPDLLVMVAHSVCRPFQRKVNSDGTIEERNARLPRQLASTYLEWRGEWNLPVLNGIASAPILSDDGRIHSGEGYHPATGMWREDVPDLDRLVPQAPAREDATAALQTIRATFRTFCFADAETVIEPVTGMDMVDLSRPPGQDESGFLAALLTAIARPSLDLAPGVLLRAAPMSGAGAGKGLLARCIATIAFGRDPHAVTGGSTTEELDKRIAAELIEGGPVLFLDNLNGRDFKSDLLASAITERPARVRILGKSQMVQLNASALVILTGNGLRVSEDLARRFVSIELDPRTEDPEARRFTTDIRSDVKDRRAELLAAALTIWRWGRQHRDLPSGRPFGNFDLWCRWVRDPLLALGCQDPAARVGEAKARDNRRQVIAEIFDVWWQCHGDRPMRARDLDDVVVRAIDPQNRSRQFVSSQLGMLAGTRVAGYAMTRQDPAGRWGVITYALIRTDGGDEGHRDHRGHGPGTASPVTSDAPYAPDADRHQAGKSASPAQSGDTETPMPPMPPVDAQVPATGVGSSRWRKRI